MSTASPTIVGDYNYAWKGRGTLQNLIEELNRQRASRVDFVTDTRYLDLGLGDEGFFFDAPSNSPASEWLTEPTPFNRPALNQFLLALTPTLGVSLYDACLGASKLPVSSEHPQLQALRAFAENLMIEAPKRRLVRVLDGHIRAYLSNRYRMLDNYDLAFTALDAAKDHGGQVIECSLSDTKMRLKFTSQAIVDSINLSQESKPVGWYSGGLGNQGFLSKVGAKSWGDLPGGPEALHPVVTVTGSETGHGGTSVRLGIMLGACFNVATVEDVVREIHLGEALDEMIFTAETITKASQVTIAKVKDAVTAAFTPERFELIAAKARGAQQDKIEAPAAAIDNLVINGDITQTDRDDLLMYFVRDYTPTRFGLAQAVSRLAQDKDDGDTSTALEDLAGSMLMRATAIA